jgi:hypothetical protein
MLKVIAILLLATSVHASELVCNQVGNKIECEVISIRSAHEPNYRVAPIVGTAVKFIIFEVSKSMAVDAAKDLIRKRYMSAYPNKPVPTKITLMRSH